jgi:hypothetical protein
LKSTRICSRRGAPGEDRLVRDNPSNDQELREATSKPVGCFLG